MPYDFGDYKKDALTRPRDIAWDKFMKWEKEGDKVSGYIRDVFYREAEGDFKAQRGLTLEQEDGTLINVGIKRLPFILAKTNSLRLGDPVTIVWEETRKPSQKGFQGAKVLSFYGKNLEENAGNKTVRELDEEDRETQGIEKDEVEKDELEEIAEGAKDK